MKETANKVSVSSLSGFNRPSDKSVLLNDSGVAVGSFDFNWSSDLLFRCEDGSMLRDDSWLGLMAKVITRFN